MFVCSVLLMSPVTAITTTVPVTVVCFRFITHWYDCYNGCNLCGHSSIESAWYSSATTADPEGHNRDTVVALPLCCSINSISPRCLSGICQFCHGSSSDEFSLSELSLPLIHYGVCWCMLWCLLSAFRSPCGSHVHHWGINCWGLQGQNPIEYTFSDICAPWWMSVAHTRSALNGCSFHCFR